MGAGLVALAQNAADTLKNGFENPPSSARPRVWWHWMNGNISKEGIQLDLDWMHRVGIAGFQNFDAALQTPQVVPKRLAYMTPEWKDAFKYAIATGDKFGMEMAIAGSPGWSESGGPWVPASQGMKKYVWSATEVEGGQPFTGKLPHPAGEHGGVSEHRNSRRAGQPRGCEGATAILCGLGGDRLSAAGRRCGHESLHPTVTASGGSPDVAMLSDGDLVKTTEIPIPPQREKAWIEYAFAEPTTIRAVTLVTQDPNRIMAMVSGIGAPEKALEASDDGQNWRR